MSDETLLEFPCDFPLKVMGLQTDEFLGTISEIVNRHVDAPPTPGIRPSRDGRYVALTFTINATSREQLDALYCELSDHELVLFAL